LIRLGYLSQTDYENWRKGKEENIEKGYSTHYVDQSRINQLTLLKKETCQLKATTRVLLKSIDESQRHQAKSQSGKDFVSHNHLL
jgi:hypothetical protein